MRTLFCFYVFLLSVGMASAAPRELSLSDGSTTSIVSFSQNGIEIAAAPELGGKIISLKGPDGKERLSRSTRPYVKRSTNLKFVDSEFDGIDEIFPSLSASPAGSNHPVIPDHGELWTSTWRVLPGSGIQMEVHGELLAYRLVRKISIEGRTVLFSYALSNAGQTEIPYIYLFHPLFAADSGLDMDLPESLSVKIKGSKKNFLGKKEEVKTWGELKKGPLEGILYSTDRGHYWNAVLPEFSKARICLTWTNAGALALSWDKGALPYCAFWSTEGAILGGLRHFAVEPTTATAENLNAAQENGEARRLAPGAVHHWTIRLSFEK